MTAIFEFGIVQPEKRGMVWVTITGEEVKRNAKDLQTLFGAKVMNALQEISDRAKRNRNPPTKDTP